MICESMKTSSYLFFDKMLKKNANVFAKVYNRKRYPRSPWSQYNSSFRNICLFHGTTHTRLHITICLLLPFTKNIAGDIS